MPDRNNNSPFKTGLVIAVLILLQLVLAIILFIFAYSSVANTRFLCVQINELKRGTLAQIVNSDHRLRDPKLRPQYYKDHPGELEQVLEIDKKLIIVYQPGKCHGFFGR